MFGRCHSYCHCKSEVSDPSVRPNPLFKVTFDIRDTIAFREPPFETPFRFHLTQVPTTPLYFAPYMDMHRFTLMDIYNMCRHTHIHMHIHIYIYIHGWLTPWTVLYLVPCTGAS